MDDNALVAKVYAMMTLEQKKKTAHDLNDSLQILLELIHQDDPDFVLV